MRRAAGGGGVGLTVREEPLTADLLAEAAPLADAHGLEVGGRVPRLAGEVLLALAARGAYRVFTARELASGVLVGYCGLFVVGDPHNAGEVAATEDAIYLAPAARVGLAGLAFVRAVDRILVDSGVVIVYRASPSSRDLGPLLRRAGYVPVETKYARRLSAWASPTS